MDWIEAIGWAASGLTVLTYSMRTMVPLRIAATLSSLGYLIYAILLPNMPLLAMELVLLPLNLWRLREVLLMRRRLRLARGSDGIDFGLLRRIGRPRSYAPGAQVFRVGEPPEHLYFIESGQVELDELGVTLGDGDVFGEIAFFTDANRRTATAVCRTDCRIFIVDEEAFLKLYFLDPKFAMAIMKMITRRLIAGMDQRPDLYRQSAANPPATG